MPPTEEEMRMSTEEQEEKQEIEYMYGLMFEGGYSRRKARRKTERHFKRKIKERIEK